MALYKALKEFAYGESQRKIDDVFEVADGDSPDLIANGFIELAQKPDDAGDSDQAENAA